MGMLRPKSQIKVGISKARAFAVLKSAEMASNEDCSLSGLGLGFRVRGLGFMGSKTQHWRILERARKPKCPALLGFVL